MCKNGILQKWIKKGRVLNLTVCIFCYCMPDTKGTISSKTLTGILETVKPLVSQYKFTKIRTIFSDYTELGNNISDLHEMLDAIPDIVFQIDSKGTFEYINNAIAQLGYSPEELIGEHFSVIIHPDDIDTISRAVVLPLYEGKETGSDGSPGLFDERRTGRRSTKHLRFRLNSKTSAQTNEDEYESTVGELMSTGFYDGEFTTISYKNRKKNKGSTNISPVEKNGLNQTAFLDNMFIGTVGIIRNITAQLELERQKAALQEQMRQSEKLEALGQLAGGIAHDFNNILGAISGYAELISRRGAEVDEKIEKYGKMILSGTTRAANSISKLLSFSRKAEFSSSVTDLHSVVTDLVSVLSNTIDKRIQIKTDFAAYNTTIYADIDQIQNAVMNIALNARDAMPQGGTLTFKTENSMLSSQFLRKKGKTLVPGVYVVLLISDTGVGMNKRTLSRVFEPFFSTKTKNRGTGLGLASAYGAIESHRGFMLVDSTIGAGSEFSIYLPVCSQYEGTVESDQNTPSDEKVHRNVMVIDDEEFILDACTEMLESFGYTVRAFASPLKAIDYFRLHCTVVDLVIIDMIMPELYGVECFRKLKEIDPQVQVVLSSGYSLESDAKSMFDEGVKHFIKKPFSVKQLREVVSKAIERR